MLAAIYHCLDTGKILHTLIGKILHTLTGKILDTLIGKILDTLIGKILHTLTGMSSGPSGCGTLPGKATQISREGTMIFS